MGATAGPPQHTVPTTTVSDERSSQRNNKTQPWFNQGLGEGEGEWRREQVSDTGTSAAASKRCSFEQMLYPL